MDAKKLFKNKQQTYIYLERYVNNGSPSGFTDLHTTSDSTNPFKGKDRFHLLEFDDRDVSCIILGKTEKLFQGNINYAHPDSINSEVLRIGGRKLNKSEFVVSPTSGGRTMLIRESNYIGYIKLTYDIARIGRVDRQLTFNHCLSSIEVTESLKKCIDENKFPSTFSLLIESSAKISMLETQDSIYEWGTIYREGKPYPYTEDNVQLVPGFSLFSVDRKSKKDEYLINQFIELSNSDPNEYLINLLKMIVDCYWAVVLNCAFHLECHGQNCLFEVDEEFNITRIVIKDMDSVDKDIPLAKYFGFKYNWKSCPYMCFDESIYFYSIRPSFIYDFKLGEYLLSPLIKSVADKFHLNKFDIEKEVRGYVKATYTYKLPDFYFPSDGCWYNCDNTERKPGTRRKYFAHENPKFR